MSGLTPFLTDTVCLSINCVKLNDREEVLGWHLNIDNDIWNKGVHLACVWLLSVERFEIRVFGYWGTFTLWHQWHLSCLDLRGNSLKEGVSTTSYKKESSNESLCDIVIIVCDNGYPIRLDNSSNSIEAKTINRCNKMKVLQCVPVRLPYLNTVISQCLVLLVVLKHEYDTLRCSKLCSNLSSVP